MGFAAPVMAEVHVDDKGLLRAHESLDTPTVPRYATAPMSQRSQEDDLRVVERLTNDQYMLVDVVLASEVLSKDWSQTWARLASLR